MTLRAGDRRVIDESLESLVIPADASPKEVQAQAAKWRAILRKARKAWREYDEHARSMHQAMERARANLARCVNHPRYSGKQGGSDDGP